MQLDTETGISVAIRIRPFNQRELNNGETEPALVNDHQSILVRSNPPNQFNFDHVLDDSSCNMDVYHAVAKDVVQNALLGINGTIFAYGQTSTGKTHTMFGSKEEPGVMPLATENIFNSIAQDTGREYLLRASYIEIYNENIRDLLKPTVENLKIHQNPQGEIFVGDLSEQMVSSISEINEILTIGDRNRRIGETNMNEKSSRSHTIFRLTIESRERPKYDGSGSGAIRVSMLNLVDLAGSERVGHTGAEGQRLIEGGHINKSLLALGTVISKLSEGDSLHIPYRDSKLTRILQSSLGGNAKTSIVCTVTPAMLHIDETLSTLRFATRAKKITNRPKVNEILSDSALLKIYKDEINDLKRKLGEAIRSQGRQSATPLPPTDDMVALESENDTLKKKVASLELMVEETSVKLGSSQETISRIGEELMHNTALYQEKEDLLRRAESEMLALKEQNGALYEQISSLEESSSFEINDTIASKNHLIGELQSELDRLKCFYEGEKETKSDLEKTVERLQEQFKDMKISMENDIQNFKGELQLLKNEKMAFQDAYSSLEFLLEEANVKLEVSFEENFKLQEQVVQMDSDCRKIKQEKEELLVKFKAEQIPLQDENHCLKSKIASLDFLVDETAVTLSVAEEENAKLVEELKVACQTYQEKEIAIQSEILELQNQNQYLQQEMATKTSNSKAELDEAISAKDVIITNLQSELQHLAKSLEEQRAAMTSDSKAELNHALSAKDETIANLELRLNCLRMSHEQQGQKEIVIENITRELEDARNQKTQLEKTIEDLNLQSKGIMDENLRLQAQLTNILSSHREEKEELLAELENRKELYHSEIEGLNFKAASLQSMVEETTLKATALEGEKENVIAELQLANATHQEKKDALKIEILELQEQKRYLDECLASSNTTLNDIISVKEKIIADLETELDHLQKSHEREKVVLMERLTRELDDQKQQSMDLQKAIDDLNEQVKEKERETIRWQEQIRDLESLHQNEKNELLMKFDLERQEMKEGITGLLSERDQLLENLEQEYSESRRSHDEEISRLVKRSEEQLDSLTKKSASIEQERNQLTGKVDEYLLLIEGLQGKLTEGEQILSQTKLELKETIQSKDEAILQLQNQLEDAQKSQRSALSELVENSKAEIKVLQQKNASLKDKVLQLEALLEKSTAQIAAAEQKVRIVERERSATIPLSDSKSVNVLLPIETKPVVVAPKDTENNPPFATQEKPAPKASRKVSHNRMKDAKAKRQVENVECNQQ